MARFKEEDKVILRKAQQILGIKIHENHVTRDLSASLSDSSILAAIQKKAKKLDEERSEAHERIGRNSHRIMKIEEKVDAIVKHFKLTCQEVPAVSSKLIVIEHADRGREGKK